jgi:hypothetical protein
MGKYDKLPIKILRGTSDQNIDFEELRKLLLKWVLKKELKAVTIY